MFNQQQTNIRQHNHVVGSHMYSQSYTNQQYGPQATTFVKSKNGMQCQFDMPETGHQQYSMMQRQSNNGPCKNYQHMETGPATDTGQYNMPEMVEEMPPVYAPPQAFTRRDHSGFAPINPHQPEPARYTFQQQSFNPHPRVQKQYGSSGSTTQIPPHRPAVPHYQTTTQWPSQGRHTPAWNRHHPSQTATDSYPPQVHSNSYGSNNKRTYGSQFASNQTQATPMVQRRPQINSFQSNNIPSQQSPSILKTQQREKPRIIAPTQTQPMPTQTQLTQSDKKSDEKIHKIFLAVNCHGMRAWSQYKSHFFPIFEIFGMLDSRLTSISGGKSFVIRDGQGSQVECVFFETDRRMAEMRRGRAYRCVGEYDTRNDKLKCVSVRDASPDQFQAHRRLVALTTTSMRRRVAGFASQLR